MSGPERMQAQHALTDAALALLRAEMQALALLLPGLPPVAARVAAEHTADEMAEARFDNLPV